MDSSKMSGGVVVAIVSPPVRAGLTSGEEISRYVLADPYLADGRVVIFDMPLQLIPAAEAHWQGHTLGAPDPSIPVSWSEVDGKWDGLRGCRRRRVALAFLLYARRGFG
jgi:hypothetical protein